MPHRILDDDHGIVDDKPGRDRQSHQGEIVKAVAQFVEHCERADQRQRHGDGGNDGCPDVAQEEKDDHHHQGNRKDQRELHVLHRGADGLGSIGNGIDLDVGGDGSLQHRHHCLDAVDRRDDVGPGRALDRQDDRPFFVEPGGDQIVFGPFDRLSHILHPHRRAIAVGDDQVVIGLWFEQLVVGIEYVALTRAVECALRQIDIVDADHTAHIFEAQPARGQRLRIDLDADGWFLPSGDTDQADAGYLRDLLQQNVFRVGIDRRERQRVGSCREHEDRCVGRVHFVDRWRVGQVGRQIGTRRIDGRQRVGHASIDAPTQIELQRDLRVAQRARRGHLGETGDLPELRFERRCHGRGHGLRIGARQLRGDLKRRIARIWQRRDRQQWIGREAP